MTPSPEPTFDCNHFFHHVYDPTEEDIRRLFPSYTRKSSSEWAAYYNEYRAAAGMFTPASDASFALRKLSPVTTSRKLTDDQRAGLQSIIDGNDTRWDAFCNLLTPAQIEHVGW